MNAFDFAKDAAGNLWNAIGEGNWSKVLIILFVIVAFVEGVVIYKLDARVTRIQNSYDKEVSRLIKDAQTKLDSVVILRFEDKEKALEEKQQIIDMFTKKKEENESIAKSIEEKDKVIQSNTVLNNKEAKALIKDLQNLKR